MKRDGLIDLNGAIQHPGCKLAFEVSTSLGQEQDLDLLEPVTGSLHVECTGNLLILSGEFRSRCVLECARCGAPLETDLDFEMEDHIVVEGTPSCYGTGDFARVEPEEDFPIFDGNSLICDAYVRQGVLINLPGQPLCKFGWDGACPHALRTESARPDTGHPGMQNLGKLLHPQEPGA
ncbi:MAG: DUF177 domain-containing protein [Armatimonadetes bacterium]|nr:DUF177 domain-containing protein [Armatimonadota bacterium]